MLVAAVYKVLKNTAKAGNAIIGAGVYSAVLQSGEAWKEKVIKIGNNTDDPWLDYVELFQKSPLLQNNIHTPCVDRVYIDHNSEYYVANMEQLDTHTDFENDLKLELCDSIKNLVMGEETKEEFRETWAEYSEFFPSGMDHFFLLTDEIERQTDCFTFDDEEEWDGVDDYARKLDLHAANIMFRNNCVVITDPWCTLRVEDNPSMEDYIDQSDDRDIEYQCHIWSN